MRRLEGKLAIITGGGKATSIGYAIASAFAADGADLVLVGSSKRKLAEARELERMHGIQTMPVHMPYAEASSIEQAVVQVVERFGRIDILVNCLQAVKVGLISDLKVEDLEQSLQQGILAPYAWMQRCYPHLRKTKGAIINFDSASAANGQPAMAALATLRGGLQGLGRVAAAEWSEDGIALETVHACAMTAQLEKLKREFPDEYEATLASMPEKPVSVDEVGRRCVELAVNMLAR